MMKKTVLLLLAIFAFSSQSMKAIELEPRAGISLVHEFGLHTGAYVSFPVSDIFAIQTGGLLYSGDNNRKHYSKWNIGLNIPVYASFRLPVSQTTNVRLNVGPYVGVASFGQLGLSAEAGVEVKRLYLGAMVFKNFVIEKETQLGISIGYKFSL